MKTSAISGSSRRSARSMSSSALASSSAVRPGAGCTFAATITSCGAP
jgi:hypothetical protein